VKAGQANILIGTHRILSQDIAFQKLGLLIIDEEQRFGVKAKEKIKQYRHDIDVLSMTATPIPRTLHMSLVGARDLSIINTPPRNRLPIETTVTEYHDDLVKNAIEDELERGGQVYFVDNRIRNLPMLQDKIEELVPNARIAVGHGQMDEKELELVMKEFVAGRFDVLLATTIIENGLDISNVNTIIVSRADMMGLSQLYQLRGRVGRSSEQAYAYLLTPAFKQVGDVSLKRLRALEQYTDLGSGFQIAMRDLEIRGAGNILGTSQHGFIAAVGFEMYCRLLKETIDELQGQPPPRQAPDTKVEVDCEAYIPTEYVSDAGARIALYQQLAAMEVGNEIDEMERALVDRFGPIPQPVITLLLLMRVKVGGRALGCSQVAVSADGALSLQFDGAGEEVKKALALILGGSKYPFEISYDEKVTRLKSPLKARATLERIRETVELLTEVVDKKQRQPG
jgi:transcription-repair coupling factor (superfamily II helicase)